MTSTNIKNKFIFRSENLFAIHRIDKKPDVTEFKYHTHLMCEIYYFIRGGATFHVEGTKYALKPGDIVIMRPTEAHYVELDPNQEYERLVINFGPELLRSIDPNTKLLKPFLERDAGTENLYRPEDPDNSPFLPGLRGFMQSHGDRMTMLANLILLLNQIESIYSSKLKNAKKPTALEAILLSYIQTHLPQQISLETLCSRYFISKSQLNRRFKAATGTTVGKYILTKRLIMAQQFIRSGTAPTEACSQCGFQDYSAFYRAYSKYFGHSPKEEQTGSPIPNAEDYKLIIK